MAFDFLGHNFFSVDYLTGVVTGNIGGHNSITLSGNNVSQGTVLKAIWGGGLTDYTWLASPEGLRIFSGNNAATNAFQVDALDANYVSTTLTGTLTGTTPVNLGTFLRVNDIRNVEPGRSLGTMGAGQYMHVAGSGAITAGTAAGNLIRTCFDPWNVSHDCLYTVPAGKQAVFYGGGISIMESSGVSAKAVDFNLFIGSTGFPLFNRAGQGMTNLGGNPTAFVFGVPQRVPSGFDAIALAVSDAQPIEVSAVFHGILSDV